MVTAWRKNGFITAAGKPVENQDIVIRLDSALQHCARQKINLAFQWVRAHESEPSKENSVLWKFWYGNQIADQLAREGSLKK